MTQFVRKGTPPTGYARQDVAAWVGPKTFDKALGYVRAVSDITWTGSTLRARVKGTQADPYDVDISFEGATPSGVCSCPVGYQCKHVAATLLAALDARERASKSGLRFEVEQWLSGFRERVRQAQIKAATPASGGVNHQILYVLAPARGVAVGGEVSTFKARLGVDGSIRAAERWSPGLTAWSNPPRFVTPDDNAILRALRSERGHSIGAFTLRGKKGAALWRMMLATGRLYCETDLHDRALDRPLRESAPRRADIEWIPLEHDTFRPSLETDPESRVVLPTEPAWYIDTVSRETGPVESPIPEELLVDYLQMPAMTFAEAAIVRAAMREFAPLLPGPPGNDDEAGLQTIDEAPIPVLTLDTLAVGTPARLSAPTMELDIALLDFDYGGIVIAAGSPEALTRLSDGTLARIVRDTGAERAVMATLIGMGLRSISDAHVTREQSPYAGGFIMSPREAWQRFVAEHVPALREKGWRIGIASNSRFDLVEVEEIDALAHAGDDGWFDLELGITVDAQPVRLAPLLTELFDRDRRWLNGHVDAIDDTDPIEFRTDRGRRFSLRAARIKPLVRTLIDLFSKQRLDAHTPLRVPALEAARLSEHDDALRWQFSGADTTIELVRRLRGVRALREIAPPDGLKAQLRDYQRAGLDWMQFLREYDLAGVLADDMGLGKTVQTLAHILTEKEAGRLDRPALIVVPTTLVHNWETETRRFAPGLNVLHLHGPMRHERFASIPAHDMVITTYPLLWRDHEALTPYDYHLLILDEAQYVKNASSKAAASIRGLRARHRLCLTGTPLENHLGELWSQFDFLLPGFLGTQKDFASRWRKPIEKQDDHARRDLLARRIRPFMLRRRKDDVARELPAKTTIVRSVELDGPQRDLYETVRAAMQEKVRDAIAKQGLARSHILMLDALLKLRQVCCDPSLLKLAASKQVERSAKLELLLDMLPELIEEGRRVLVFSQFTGMLAIIAAALDEAGLRHVMLTGDTKDRKTPVQRFQAGEVPVFLISLKAGGVGLNLTAADTVIHYDPWWNPAAENQATDRAHRIGQDKPVFVYKLIAAGSIEEKILEMQERKAALAAGILSEDAGAVEKFSAEDIDALFAPMPEIERATRATRVPKITDTD